MGYFFAFELVIGVKFIYLYSFLIYFYILFPYFFTFEIQKTGHGKSLRPPRNPIVLLIKTFKGMEKIKIPDQNTFEEKAKAFAQSKLGRKLANKYTPKPYEERRKGLYVFAWVASFFCNMVAIVTGSTFVFAYAFGLVAKLPEPMILAGIIAGIILVGIEALKQLLVPDLFQDWFQYGWKGAYFLRVGVIVGLVIISTGFNYFGGFDLVGVVSTPPQFEAPTLKNADQVRKEYTPKIEQAGKEAETYRQSKLWNGRLSDDNASVYRDLLGEKSKLEKQELAKLDSVEAFNDRATATAKQEHAEKVKTHESKTEIKGRGLAVFSVVCELLFILFCWYRERYEYKTATQYATVEDETPPKNTGHSQNQTTTPPLNTAQSNGQTNGTTATVGRLPIGFYTTEQRQTQMTAVRQTQGNNGTQNGELIVFTRTYENTKFLDTFTIEHNGKRYKLADVERFARTYKERLKQSEREGNTDTARTRRERLEYWKGRRAELVEKIERASK